MIKNFKEYKDECKQILNDPLLARATNRCLETTDWEYVYQSVFFIRGTRYGFVVNLTPNKQEITWFHKRKKSKLPISFEEILQNKYISEKAKNFLVFNLEFFRHSTQEKK